MPKRPAKPIGFPIGQYVPADPADHAQDFAQRYAEPLDWYCTIRMQELGIPEDKNGAPNFDRDGRWRAFEWRERTGGSITKGVYVNSGVLNPDLMRGRAAASGQKPGCATGLMQSSPMNGRSPRPPITSRR